MPRQKVNAKHPNPIGDTKLDAAAVDVALSSLSDPLDVEAPDLAEEIRALKATIEELIFVMKLAHGL